MRCALIGVAVVVVLVPAAAAAVFISAHQINAKSQTVGCDTRYHTHIVTREKTESSLSRCVCERE